MKVDSVIPLSVTSTSFEQGGKIPSRYTCDGANVSPPLRWKGAPEDTSSFVLITDDPDAPMGTWVHWIVYNIPGTLSELPEAVAKKAMLNNGSKQGRTSFGDIGYGGPCPPSGSHRYFFKIYALDTELTLDPQKATKNTVLNAIEDHVIAYGELMGTYKRK